MTRKSTRRGLRVEGLEERHMMAGDVTASVTNHVLTLTGGVAENGLVITGLSGQIQVTGLEQGGSATTINGNHRVTYKSIQQVFIDLGDGDDALVITSGTIKSSLAIEMGDGDDIVGLGQFYNKTEFLIPGTLRHESLVDDAVDPLLKPLATTLDMTLDLGDGDNTLRARAVTIGKNLSLIAGTGDDKINLEEKGIPGAVDYLAGIRVGLDTAISSGGGNDKIKIDRFATRNFVFSSEAGDDIVDLLDITVAQNSIVAGGDGFDVITLNGFSTRILTVSGEAGDDDIYLNSVKVATVALIDGGTGDNILHNLGGNVFRTFISQYFATFTGPIITSQVGLVRRI